MDIPWELLDAGLKILFSRYNMDILHIAQPRLDHSDMEYILYRLFLIIDPKETRKIQHPSRNQDDKTKFINTMVMLVNKHLPHAKISAARLRMCGGAPFRDLMASLIKKAAEIDLNVRSKRLDLPKPSEVDADVSRNRLMNEKQRLDNHLESLDNVANKLDKMKELQSQYQDHKLSVWKLLEHKNVDDPFNRTRLKKIQNLLTLLLVKTTEECVVATNKIAAIEVPSPGIEPKRLSFYVRELQAQMNSSGGLDSSLDHYDEAMEALLIKLEEKKRVMDEDLLRDPRILERFKKMTSLIPLIKLKPII